MAANTRHNLSRRQALAGIGIATALVATPVAGATITAKPDRRAWNRAEHGYTAAKAEFDRLWSAHDAAEEAWERACPRVARYFDEYKLGIGMKREAVVRKVALALCIREFGGRTSIPFYPAAERARYEAGLRKINAEAERIADEFMAYQERSQQSKQLHHVDQWREQAEAYGEAHYFPARDALMATPAPDNAALLAKIEIAAVSCDDEHLEAVAADARRLLGRA